MLCVSIPMNKNNTEARCQRKWAFVFSFGRIIIRVLSVSLANYPSIYHDFICSQPCPTVAEQCVRKKIRKARWKRPPFLEKYNEKMFIQSSSCLQFPSRTLSTHTHTHTRINATRINRTHWIENRTDRNAHSEKVLNQCLGPLGCCWCCFCWRVRKIYPRYPVHPNMIPTKRAIRSAPCRLRSRMIIMNK